MLHIQNDKFLHLKFSHTCQAGNESHYEYNIIASHFHDTSLHKKKIINKVRKTRTEPKTIWEEFIEMRSA